MKNIICKFIQRAKLSANTSYFPPDVAILIIKECKEQGVPIYGIDAVEITNTYTQPFMEHSADYTASPYPAGYFENVWDEAIQFIKSKECLGLHFEVIIPEVGR